MIRTFWDTSPPASQTGFTTSHELAVAAMSDGEWLTEYPMGPSRGSPVRHAIDYIDMHNERTGIAAPAGEGDQFGH